MISLKKTLALFLATLILSGSFNKNHKEASEIFDDPKVIELALAAKSGDTETIDRLISEGVDIHTLGKEDRDVLFWLFVMNPDNQKKKQGFRHLLKSGSNPTNIAEDVWTVLHLSARHKDPYYLKAILKEKPEVAIDFKFDNSMWATPLIQALITDRYQNFEILLNHGAGIETETGIENTPLTMASGNGTWKFAYSLLQRGADYTFGEGKVTGGNPEGKSDIVWSLEELRYWPSVAIKNEGVDYREKVIEFLREKGMEVNPWYPEDHGFDP